MGADGANVNDEARSRRVHLFGMDIDVVRESDVLEQLERWIAAPFESMHYVVTPNVQHTMVFQENAAFREAYGQASLVIADGLPLVLSSHLFGTPLPERVAGSDLLPLLFDRTSPARRPSVFLLGAAPGVGEHAAARVAQRWPHVNVVGTYSPPFGFERDDAENSHILELVRQASPDILVVGLGAPKQELWTYRFKDQIRAKVALCIGGSIDFLAGTKARAPRWMQRSGLEWIHRAATEPKRLGPRYAEHAVLFPMLVLRELRKIR
jgi:N-acetylglucosaminyldiphosphoundecaprenol N-acetyl-beta-D-mannosaminyltransferase